MFQRFCLLLLIVHGELDSVQDNQRSVEYLKGLNVYNEVVHIVESIDEHRYSIRELVTLH